MSNGEGCILLAGATKQRNTWAIVPRTHHQQEKEAQTSKSLKQKQQKPLPHFYLHWIYFCVYLIYLQREALLFLYAPQNCSTDRNCQSW